MNVLVVNAGSSSLKYQLFNTTTNEVYSKGICERIGTEGSLIDHKQLQKDLKDGESHQVEDEEGNVSYLWKKERKR